MAHKKVFALILVACLVFLGFYVAKKSPPNHAVKAYIEREIPTINQVSDYQKAVLLRDYVYRNAQIGPSFTPVLPLTVNTLQNIKRGTTKMMCGNMASEYHALLRLWSIPSRIVQLQTRQGFAHRDDTETHVVSEVFLNNQWILMDPTFNIHWELNGQKLGVVPLRTAFKHHQDVQPNTDNMRVIQGRSVATYYLPYSSLLDYVFIAEQESFGANAGAITVLDTLPKSSNWIYRLQVAALHKAKHVKRSAQSWEFHKPNPLQGWEIQAASYQVHPSKDGMSFHFKDTGLLNARYLLLSPIFSIPQGSIEVSIKGIVQKGGLEIQLMDAQTKTWIPGAPAKFRDFQFANHKDTPQLMIKRFEVSEPKSVQIVLTNYSFEADKSGIWDFQTIQVG